MPKIESARAVVFDDKKRVLALQYSDYSHLPEVKHTWGIPGGGSNLSETIEQTLERELSEETGLSLVASKKVYDYKFIDQRGNDRHDIYFLCKTEGTVRLSKEHERYTWIPLSEISSYDWINKMIEEVIREAAKAGP